MSRYGELSKAELVALLEQRDRRDATRFGLVRDAKGRGAVTPWSISLSRSGLA